ncbi:hypothetical protein [Priestia taiwanensis]|uniref:Toxin/Nuclease N-terminal domain-containing protein n=1 Tax=Priestia taiwanensis TaxID=1347902 RepID=A0A917AK02_9BACI|nr:hypothetical protein [Priestia taiwanensis]MBM7361522.1 hypothetical protein [Priestia taiwanensis]GGE54843.1 hypothetical protein GCM10007140_01450 [Priestia taiwanensis]
MDVRYKHGPWQEMKESIIRLKRDSERTFLQMDDLLGSIERKIDRLDSDRSISFHHTSKKITINHLFDDYDQLVNYCHRVGETVSRHIDEPFYHKMDEFAGKMRDLSIRNYTTENRIGSTEYKAMPTAHSYGRLETSSVQKDTITIDDIFKDSVAFDEILNLQYEEMKRNNPEAKLDYNEYRKLIPSMRGFEYETMEEAQQDLEMWRDLAIAAGIIVAAVVCPPVAIAATAVFTGIEVKSVVTGEDWGTGRKLSIGEQIERGAFSVLGVIPGVKGVRQAFRGTDDLISLTKQSIAQNLAKFNPNTGKNVVQSLKDSNTYWTQKLRLEGLKATDKLNDMNYAIKGAFARSLDNMNNLAAQSIDVTAGGAALGRGGSNVEDVVKASHLESKGIIQSKIEKVEGSIKGTVKDKPFGKYSTAIDDKVKVIEKVDLADWISESFTDGNYRTVVTEENITFYRTYGGGAKASGAFVTTSQAGNRINAKISTALVPDWKNSRQYEAVIEVPKGQILNIGRVEKQYTKTGALLEGDGDQILLPQGWPSEWIKETREVPSR